MKVVSITRKTTAKTPRSMMTKTPRKNLHWGTKENSHHHIWLRSLTAMMKMTTEPVPRTTTARATATSKVKGIPAPDDDPHNGKGS